MPLRTPAQYVESLRDGRELYFRGARVAAVTTHPVISKAVKLGELDFEMAEDPAHRDLAVVRGDDGSVYSRYYAIPKSADDLLARSRLIEAGTVVGKTM